MTGPPTDWDPRRVTPIARPPAPRICCAISRAASSGDACFGATATSAAAKTRWPGGTHRPPLCSGRRREMPEEPQRVGSINRGDNGRLHRPGARGHGAGLAAGNSLVVSPDPGRRADRASRPIAGGRETSTTRRSTSTFMCCHSSLSAAIADRPHIARGRRSDHGGNRQGVFSRAGGDDGAAAQPSEANDQDGRRELPDADASGSSGAGCQPCSGCSI